MPANLAFFQFLFRGEAQPAGQAAMMRRHIVFAQSFAQVVCDSLRQPPGVDEHQRGTVLLNQFHQPVVNFVPHLVGRDRSQGRAWYLHREIKLPLVSDIHNHRSRSAVAGQEVGNFFDRLLGC